MSTLKYNLQESIYCNKKVVTYKVKIGREFQFPLININQLYSRERKLREFRESDVGVKISRSESLNVSGKLLLR